MLGHPVDLPAAILNRIMAGPVICQHLVELAFQAVLHRHDPDHAARHAQGCRYLPSAPNTRSALCWWYITVPSSMDTEEYEVRS